MALAANIEREMESEPKLKPVSATEGRELLDRQARKYLQMSSDAFLEKYRAGEIEDADRTDVLRVAMLIPLAEQ